MLPIAALVACSDYGISSPVQTDSGIPDGTATTITDPDLGTGFMTLSPRVLRFDGIEWGGMGEGTVTIRNTTTETHSIEDVSLNLIDASPFVVSGNTSVSLDPGEEHTLTIEYSPTSGLEQIAELFVTTDDIHAPTLVGHLSGQGYWSVLQAIPDTIDFEDVEVDCRDDRVLTIRNGGGAPMVVEDLVLTGDVEYTLTGATPPFEVESETTVDLTIDFAPDAEVAQVAQVDIRSDSPTENEVLVPVDGRGVITINTESRVQPEEPQGASILLVVDNSCSMDDDQLAMANNFSSFISELSSLNNWRLGVVTTDSGNFVGDVLTPSTSNLDDEFATQVQVGILGHYEEKGFEMAKQALDGDASSSSFLPTDNALHIVFVSDEDDQSGGPVDDWVSTFEGYHDPVYAHGVIGQAGCSYPGLRYRALIDDFGGVTASICQDWGTTMADLGDAVASGLEIFRLTEPAMEHTIKVFVDGNQQSSGWSYDADDNEVVFDQATMPVAGAVIEVEYRVDFGC